MVDLGPAWIALGGGLFGSIAGAITTRMTLNSAARVARERNAHEATLVAQEREAAVEAGRITYQVETLLELQMAAQRVVRATGRMVHHDQMEHRKSGRPYGTGLFPKQWSADHMHSASSLQILQSRVTDGLVRTTTQNLLELCHLAIASKDDADATRYLSEAADVFVALQAGIGDRLQQLPAPSVYRPLVESPFLDREGETFGQSVADQTDQSSSQT